MTLEQIQEQANALFSELNQLKLQEEDDGRYVDSFRVNCINQINAFFQRISENRDGIELHTISINNKKSYSKSVVVFEKAPSPIDIELVCTSIRIHVPNWFRLVCEKYLGIDFSKVSHESSFYEDNWMLKEVQELKKQMSDYQSENENLHHVIERFVITSQKFNLFGDEAKSEHSDIELKGLLMYLIDDFEMFGWDIASNIGVEENNDSRFLNIYIEKDIYVNAVEPLKELKEEHKLSRVYEIIKNSVHNANKEYLEAIIKNEEPKVHWNFINYN